MIFITGPLFSGKKQVAMDLLGCTEAQLAQHAVWDVQDMVHGAADLTALADELAAHEVVIATEVGSGVVPMDKDQRADREAAGRLAILLARRAGKVIRVYCGIPTVLKEEAK